MNQPTTAPADIEPTTAQAIEMFAVFPLAVKSHGRSGTRAPTAKEANEDEAATSGFPPDDGSIPSSSRT